MSFPLLPQHHRRAHRPRPLVPGNQIDAIARLAANDPFDLSAVVGDMIIRPERNAGVLVGLALELADLLPPLAGDEFHTRWNSDFREYPAHHLALLRPLAHVAWQPAGILYHQPHAPQPFPQGLRVARDQLEPRRQERLPQQPWRKARELALQKLQGWIDEAVKAVPAANLDASQFRVMERLPVDVCRAGELLLAPAKELQIVFDRVIAVPVDVLVALQPRFAHRAPDLHHPAEHAQVVIDPVERAADNLFG